MARLAITVVLCMVFAYYGVTFLLWVARKWHDRDARFYRPFIHSTSTRRTLVEPGLHPAYSGPEGRLCLREETGWRFWSGLIVAFPNGRVWWIYFRRRPWLPRTKPIRRRADG